MNVKFSLTSSLLISLITGVTAAPVQAETPGNQPSTLSPQALEILCMRFPLNSRCEGLQTSQENVTLEEVSPKEAIAEEEKPNRKNGISLAPSVSTLGPGVELTKSINPHLNARIGGNLFSVDFNDTVSNIDYEAEVNLESVSAMGDIYPWKKSGFHVTLGLAYNNNRASGVGRMNGGTINIGGQTFQANDIGRVDAEVTYPTPVAPFIGIGYGNPVSKNKDLGFFIRAGALITGSPNVDFTATPNAALPQAMQNQVRNSAAAEEAQIQDDLNNFPLYPVVTLGFSYQF